MLCSSPTCSLGCELPANRGNLESFTRWNQVERVSTVSCLRDRTDQISSDPTVAVHGLLQLTFQLFSTSGSSAGRDESLLDRFLEGLDQQLEELDTCLREGRTTEHSPLGSENSRLAGRVTSSESLHLKEKEYSLLAWEFVSLEIRRCFILVNKLIGKLRK
ncbi:hypothetical protein FD754_025526 [Muntiacus muntjak]|uniref:Uncharacterized protein n=1 Tax=Muntiacus muntjak TaxID=9888 RepID=A0A5N3UIN5_MUNMU|nr:hypothetical protein FD754_025526 [Muntiacus muntjak]